MTSVPYSASYSEPHRALEALSAKRALRIGTTSCGPAVCGDLGVDAGGGDGEVGGFGLQVADLGEELLVLRGVEGLDDALAVPLVDLRLQVVAAGQQILVLRGQVGDDLVDARPEAVGVHAGARQRLVGDEVVQHLGHPQIARRSRDRSSGWLVMVSSLKRRSSLPVGNCAPSRHAPPARRRRAAGRTGSSSAVRSGAARSATSCWPRTYSARPAGVLDGDRREPVAGQVVRAGAHVQLAGVRRRGRGSPAPAPSRPAGPACTHHLYSPSSACTHPGCSVATCVVAAQRLRVARAPPAR